MYEYKAYVNRVVDGDTYDMCIILRDEEVDYGFNIKEKQFKTVDIRVRLRGVDTPETWRPKTDAEREHGERATAFVKELIEEQYIKVKTYKLGIYGRYDADVTVTDPEGNDHDLGQLLIDNDLTKLESY